MDDLYDREGRMKRDMGRFKRRANIPNLHIRVPQTNTAVETGLPSPDSDSEGDEGEESDDEGEESPTDASIKGSGPLPTGIIATVDSTSDQNAMVTSPPNGQSVDPIGDLATGATSSIITDADQVTDSDSDVRSSTSSNVGVIVGTLGLVAVLICGIVFLWRRRKKVRMQRLMVNHHEKALQLQPPGSQPYEGAPRHPIDSWSYFHANGATAPPNYRHGHEKSGSVQSFSRAASMRSPPYIPSMPTPVHSRQPSKQFSHNSRQHSRQMSQGTNFPSPRGFPSGIPPSPAPGLFQPPRARSQQPTPPANPVPSGLFANVSFDYGQNEAARHSVAYTEATNTTDSTWTTWNVGQKKKPSPGKKNWKGKYIG